MSATKHPLPIQTEIENCNQYLIRLEGLKTSALNLRNSLRSEHEANIYRDKQIFDMDLKDFLNTEMGEGITMMQKL